MEVVVCTPEGELFQGPADVVTVSTESGLLQVYPGHASLQGTIPFSMLHVLHGGREEEYLVRNGLLLISGESDHVRILGMQIELRTHISHKTAQEYLTLLLRLLEKPHELTELHLQHLESEKRSIEQTLEFIERDAARY